MISQPHSDSGPSVNHYTIEGARNKNPRHDRQPAGDGEGATHVTVVMVSYNTRQLTLDAIRSIYASILDPEFRVDVVVVDNASVDGTPDAIEEEFPEVCLIRSQENLGFGRGNNLGVTCARGQAIMLLNTDTSVRSGAIERLYDALYADPKRGVVGPFLENPDGSYQNSMASFPSVWGTFCNYFWLTHLFSKISFFADEYMSHADPSVEQDVDVVNGAAMMIRAELYKAVGGFDRDYFMYYEETDLCRRVAREGYTMRYIPSARVMHLISQSSHKKQPAGWFYSVVRTSRMTYARKHMNPVSRGAMALIMHAGHALRILLYYTVGAASPRLRVVAYNMWMSYTSAEVRRFDPRKKRQ
jgi:GT2 family glycosyltransferase